MKQMRRGFTLIEVMIAIGMLGIISYSVMALIKNMTTAQASTKQNFELQELLFEMRTILNNPLSCRLSFAGDDPKNAVSFQKTMIDEPERGEGIEVELWLGNQTGTKRLTKKFSGVDPQFNKLGTIQLQSMKIIFNNGKGFNYQNSPSHTDVANFRVTYLKGSKTLYHDLLISFGLKTDANGKTTMVSCSHEAPGLIENTDFSMLFGGMYGLYDGGTYNNPFTGSLNCPVGYAATKALGQLGFDSELFYCYRKADDKTNPFPQEYYAFGGVFGVSLSGVSFPNPYTGGQSCPPDYSTQNTYGSAKLDGSISFCYKKLDTTIPNSFNSFSFGGLFSVGDSPYFPNVATGSYSCPVAHQAFPIAGASLQDTPLFVCIKK